MHSGQTRFVKAMFGGVGVGTHKTRLREGQEIKPWSTNHEIKPFITTSGIA